MFEEQRYPRPDGLGGRKGTYVDAPEFFHRVKGHDFFQEIIPIFALIPVSSIAFTDGGKV